MLYEEVTLVCSLSIVDELSPLKLTQVEVASSLMERFFDVELVAVGCAYNICMHVFLSHEQLSITDHRILRET